MIEASSVLFEEGVNVTLRDTVPEALVWALSLLTHLGDGAVLVVIATLLYWFGTDERYESYAFVIAVGIAGLALASGLKGIFQFPRPTLAFTPAGYPGYSFPSAHALGSAVFYFTLAGVSKVGRPGQRFAIAAMLVAAVSLSRLTLGLHYLGDVVVGALLGTALALLALRVLRRDPEPAFLLAFGIAVLSVAFGSRGYTALVLGTSLGGLLGWYAVRGRPRTNDHIAVLVLGVVCLPIVLVVRALVLAVPIDVPPIAAASGYAVGTAAVLAVPVVARHLEDRWPVVQLQELLSQKRRPGPDESD